MLKRTVLLLQEERHERSVEQGAPERISKRDSDHGFDGVEVPVPQTMEVIVEAMQLVLQRGDLA